MEALALGLLGTEEFSMKLTEQETRSTRTTRRNKGAERTKDNEGAMKQPVLFIILEIVVRFDVGFQVCVGLINRLLKKDYKFFWN